MLNPFRRSVQTNSAPVVLAVDSRTENRADAPVDWFDILAGFGDGASLAGPEITPTTALSVPAVRAAIDIITGIVGTLPCSIYREAAGGGKEIAEGNPALSLVEDDANGWTGSGELRAQVTADALLWGAGYAAVVRDDQGNPRELHRLLPTAVIATIDPDTSEPSYQYNPGGAASKTYSWSDIIVIRPTIRQDNLGTYGLLTGLAPIRTAREAIALCIALEAHAARLMSAGGRPSGILSFANKLGSETAKRIKLSWQAATSGRASGSTAVLEEGGKFQPLAFTSVDAQFAQMREFQIIEISRAFGVPPPFLGDHGRATWANYEQSSRQLTTFGLMPWFKAWEAAYRRVLLTDAERRAGLYAAFDLDALLQGDLLARASAYSTLISSRVMSPNEAREKEHLPAYPGGETFANPNTTSTPITPANASHGGGTG
jgi:HK97 family phage portal protein